MKKLIDYIGSRRFAIILLITTLLLILVAKLAPDISAMKPVEMDAMRRGRPVLFRILKFIQLKNVVNSPAFLAIPLFLFSSITVCTLRRVKREGLKGGAQAPPDKPGIRAEYRGTYESISGFLRQEGWTVAEGEGIFGFRGGEGFWGSALFHLGMNIVIVGIALSLMTRFNATIMLTDGYGVEAKEAFLTEMPKDFPIKAAQMENFKAVYAEGFPVDYSMDLTVWTASGEEKGTVKVNSPFNAGGYHFTAIRYGFSPRFVLSKGEYSLLDAYVNLRVLTPDMIDNFDVPGEGINVTAQFFPDHYMERKEPKTRSREPKNPVFFVEIKKGDRMLGNGFLPMNKEVSFEGYTLVFNDLKRWVVLGVSRDLGVPAVAAGFLLIVLGLVARLIWRERFVWITLMDGEMEVRGRTRYFPALFDEELRKLAEELSRKTESRIQKTEEFGESHD